MISYVENGNKFNFRVGAVIFDPKGERVLLHRLAHFDFWLLPGGRVEMLEGTENAIVREIREELDEELSVDKLLQITESFFNMKDVTYHEIAFNYLLKVPQDSLLLTIDEEFAGIEGEKYRYKWVKKSELDQLVIKPEYLKPVLKNIPKEIVHIICDER